MKISNGYHLSWNFLYQNLPEHCFQVMDPKDRIWYAVGPHAGFVSWEFSSPIYTGICNHEY